MFNTDENGKNNNLMNPQPTPISTKKKKIVMS